MTTYAPTVERHMKAFYDSLSEKDRRRYASIEAEKLGQGGVDYISQVLECDPKTIWHGKQDVETLPADQAEGRIRKRGGAAES